LHLTALNDARVKRGNFIIEMKTIVVGTDFSPAAANALNYAVELARFLFAKLILVHAFSQPIAGYDSLLNSDGVPILKEAADRALADIKEKILTNEKYFKPLIIINGESPIITNTKYHMRFLHDLKTPEDATDPVFKEKIQRRILRFKQNIENYKNILFIRQQESYVNRTCYTVNLRSELEELRDFIDILRMKYKCGNINIIYINFFII
jgi:hypothetical protein